MSWKLIDPRRLVLPAVLSVLGAAACSGDKAASGTGGSAPAPSSSAACSGTVLFGRPVPATGLSAAQCQPRCSCQGAAWQAPDYTAADVDALAAWKLVTPYAELTSDPYVGPAPAPPSTAQADAVCAVVPASAGSHDYELQTFSSSNEAKSHGAIPTHFGACGLCSPLADLQVYMKNPDLGAPVKACGLKYISGPKSAHLKCLQDLGFDLPCAEIWYYNTTHTASLCLSACSGPGADTYNLPDGTLSPCLQCDEDKSGPVFKAIAGRTRRDTGIASAICRPCSEVRPLIHKY